MGFRANVVARRAPHSGGDRGHRRGTRAPRMRAGRSPWTRKVEHESLAGKGRDELWSPAGPRPPPIPSPLSSGNPGPANPGRACPPERDAGRAEPELVPTRGTGYHAPGMKFATDRRRARTFMCTRHVGGPLDAMGDGWNGPLNKVDAFRYEIPRSYKPAMRTNGLVFIDDSMLPQLRQDQAPEQVANVATMPGILGAAMAMPDIHWGYGFPIGGVAAFDHDDGVISPGGIGYDINCGGRLVRTNLVAAEGRANLRALTDAWFENVPSGVGEGRITEVTRPGLAQAST